MKIGLSTTTVEYALAGSIADGISHYTEQLRDGLVASGMAVEGYAFDARLRRQGRALQASKPIPGGFTTLGGLGLLTGGRAKIFAPCVDVFHSTDFKVIPAKCPVVATLWDAIPVVHPEWLSPRARILAPAVLKRVAHFADRVICATEHAAGDIVRHFGVPASRVSVVPWGIEGRWLTAPSPAEVRRTLQKFALGEGYFLAVGTLQPRKNIDRLLEAYLLLPAPVRLNHQLVLVGRLGWGSEKLAERIRSLSANGSVRWLDDVSSDEEVRHLYHGARVVVLPSLYEGFGLPLLEAFASGIPTVSSNATSLPEVSMGAALEVDPRKIEQIADAMRMLAQDEDARRVHRELGLSRAAQLSIGAAVERTVSVYHLALTGT